MSPVHGKNTGIAIGGYDITRWCREVSSGETIEAVDVSCFDEPGGSKTFIQGLRDAQASWSGLLTTDAKTVRDVADDIMDLEVGVPFTIGVDRGFTTGRVCQMGTVLTTQIGVTVPLADVVSVTGDLQADGGLFSGVVLSEKALSTVTPLTGAGVDGLAASATGGFAHLHVTENTRNGTVIVKVQHSTDNTTFTDLITFATVATLLQSGQRIDLAPGATINRYVRSLVTLAGTTGGAAVRVALSRRK